MLLTFPDKRRNYLSQRSILVTCEQQPLGTYVNDRTMAKRLCLQCGGELVRAFRSSESGSGSTMADQPITTGGWRCSTCGHCFSTEQLRAKTQANVKGVVQT